MSYCEFYRERKIKRIRQERRCFGCGKKFPKGRSMWYISGLFEGHFFTSHLCGPCKNHLDKFRGDFEDGYGFGDIREGREWRVYHWRKDKQRKRGA